MQGTVFGSDKMQDWTVIAEDRRYTFPNPQPSLYDRIAAVRQIVRQVPVAGRIVFLDGAEFTKGSRAWSAILEEVVADFGEPDKNAAKFKIEAFKPHWELIQKAAESKKRRAFPVVISATWSTLWPRASATVFKHLWQVRRLVAPRFGLGLYRPR